MPQREGQEEILTQFALPLLVLLEEALRHGHVFLDADVVGVPLLVRILR